ncbi:hypothetical protein JCM17845_08700 [Iodidimonas gelatinilytica]|uniref:Uncharacterized protein n=2 Tax=Iodidimonas gelatinilytica TaxID=1236966 RepID=A0A5A7MWN6_9PROT|nr:hypothetical protein JCM17845_08700 [Iodidimonas gelatinilytica]
MEIFSSQISCLFMDDIYAQGVVMKKIVLSGFAFGLLGTVLGLALGTALGAYDNVVQPMDRDVLFFSLSGAMSCSFIGWFLVKPGSGENEEPHLSR